MSGTWAAKSTGESLIMGTIVEDKSTYNWMMGSSVFETESISTWTAIAFSTGQSLITTARTSTWTSTSESTHTSHENIPAYATLGLNGSQFALVAISTIAAVGLAILSTRKGIAKPHQTKIGQFLKTKPTCIKCGSDLPPNSKFCNNCGTEQP